MSLTFLGGKCLMAFDTNGDYPLLDTIKFLVEKKITGTVFERNDRQCKITWGKVISKEVEAEITSLFVLMERQYFISELKLIYIYI
jgi:hypothetical protein